MFAATINHPASNANIKVISSGLFKVSSNPALNNFTGFLMLQGSTTGTVPEFWNWPNKPTAANKTNVFYGVYKSKISNSEAIVSAGWGDGML